MSKCSLTRLLQLIAMSGLVFFECHTSGQTGSNVPPTVVLTNPPAGFAYEFPSIVRLKATAADADGTIKVVQFYDSTNLLGSVTQSPYNLFLTNVLRFNGVTEYVVSAVATDDGGLSSTSAPVTFYVIQDLRVPLVSIVNPQKAEVFSTAAVISITANVVDFTGWENRVSFFSDEQPIGSSAQPPYTLSITNFPPGDHLLTARYTDGLGNNGVSIAVQIKVVPFSLMSAQFSSGGQFGFTIAGLVTGNVFQVEASSNSVNWVPVLTNVASANSFQFIDSTPSTKTPRFYRGVQLAP